MPQADAELRVVQKGLRQSIERDLEDAGKRAGRSLSINLGKSVKSADALTQPLGRITGKADEFTKSMEAANARVLAFGASVGVLGAVTKGFAAIVTTTIEVEKQLASINTILGGSASQLTKFSKEIFDVARNTGQSFEVVSQAALELSRQGLESEVVVKRLNDALILSRLTGQGATEAVSGLTAAINSFRESGISSAEVLNKLSAAAISAAVSEKDLIEGVKRSGSVAVQAGVSFDELVGIIGAVQEKTARGGAVIGNSFKTIFTRLQSLEKLETMQKLGVEVTDASGAVLSATQLIKNLGNTLKELPKATQLQIAENLVGKFQIAPFLALLEDYNSETSQAIALTKTAQQATTQAYERNEALNKTLAALLNEIKVSATEVANAMGKIGVSENLKGWLDFVVARMNEIRELLDEETGNKGLQAALRGLGKMFSGPGVAIFVAVIGKLAAGLVKFGLGSLSTFFGINKAAKEQVALQGQIASTLLSSETVQKKILDIENSQVSAERKKARQTKFFTSAINEQLKAMREMQRISQRIAPGVLRGIRTKGGASGYIPGFAGGYGGEVRDIGMGVGGAPSNAKAVTIPNFNFGGGMVGPVVANNSEFIVPNFGGSGGSAIFNQDMVASMGLPPGAMPINAADGLGGPKRIPKSRRRRRATDEDERRPPAGRGAKGRDIRFAMITPFDKPMFKTEAVAKGKNYVFEVHGFAGAKAKTNTEPILKAKAQKRALQIVKEEGKKFKGFGIGDDDLKGIKFNEGAIGGFAGTVFESVYQALTSQIKDMGASNNTTFDFFGQKQVGDLREHFPTLDAKKRFVDAKISPTNENKKDFAAKMERYGAGGERISEKGSKELMNLYGGETPKELKGRKMFHVGSLLDVDLSRKTRLGKPPPTKPTAHMIKFPELYKSRGHIPNFSGGRIPNFAWGRKNKDKSKFSWNTDLTEKEVVAAGHKWNPKGTAAFRKEQAASAKKLARANRDLLGPLFAVQMAMSGLSGATSGAEEGLGRFASRLTEGLSGVTTAAFAATALSGLGKNVEGFKGKLGRFAGQVGIFGAAVGGTIAGLTMLGKMGEDSSGITKSNSDALAKMTDAVKNATISLQSLTEVEKNEIEQGIKESFGGKEGVGGQILKGLGDFFSLGFAKFDEGKLFSNVMDASVAQKGAVLATSSQQATIEQSAKQAIATLTKVQGMSVADAIKKVEGIIKRGSMLEQDSVYGGTEGGGLMKRDNISVLNQKELAIINDQLLKLFKEQNKEKDKQLKIQEEQKKKEDAINAAAALAQRVVASSALERLRVTIETAKLNKDDLNLATDRLKTAELMGEATAEELILLRNKKQILEAEITFRDKAYDGVLKMAQTTQELTLKTDSELQLREAVTEATKDGVLKDTERFKINGLINKLLEEGTSIKAVELKQLRNDIDLNKIRLNQAKERLNIEKNIALTGEAFKRGVAGEAAAARSLISGRFSDEQDPLSTQIAGLEALSGGMGHGAQTILQGRATSRTQAQIGTQKAGLQNTLNASKILQSQIKEGVSILKKDEFGFSDVEAERRLSNVKSTGDIAKILKEEVFGAAMGDKDVFDALNQQVGESVQKMTKENDARDRAAKSALLMAANTQKAADLLGDLLTEEEIKEDIATRLREGKNQAMVDARLTIDPASRARGLMVAGNRERKAQALDDDNETLYRQILEQELLAGQLIDASQQFAQNIGAALVDAIAKGQSLGDTLRQAASDFFYTMSRALMDNAVKNIISGGPGGGGFFGGFFKEILGFNTGGQVKGGSGGRDDVPALLTGGEFIMNKKAVQNYGSGFMGALNSGAVPKYANGGLFTPGTYGQGAIKGSSDLLRFATQSYTGGLQDTFLSGAGLGGLSLEPQSGRLTMFGRRNSPAFQKEQESKRKAFDLFAQQYSKNQDEKKRKEESKSGLMGSILAFGASALASNFLGGGLSSLFSKKKATGGAVPYSAGIDSVPTMLSGGEFVMNAGATQMLGAGNLAALNAGGGSGGAGSGAIVGKLDELNETIASSNTEINITVNSDGTENTNAANAPDQQRGLAVKIKDVVRQVIQDEKRLGGSLRMA
jgi:TP901 family phage tail tape measure protein